MIRTRQATRAVPSALRAIQSTDQRGKWPSVRIITNAKGLLIEHVLAISLWHTDSPLGDKLVAAYGGHYNPRYGTGLTGGPPRSRSGESVGFIGRRGALEAGGSKGARLPDGTS